MARSWYRCPNCGQASPDCFDEEGAETLAWTPDQVPCDTCGSHDVVLCPHCHHDFDPLGNERIAVPAGAPPEEPAVRTEAPRAQSSPPRSWP